MQTINLAKTDNTVAYFWDAKKQRFGQDDGDGYCNHGFKVTHIIIIDEGLFAHEIDELFSGLEIFH